ncbi:MAG: tetratricopeptide repeat protein [Thermoanaerobaculaceae bacterium]|jgi:DNA-binding winged helix-turn-helix (wHTH) protein/TolB-like protein|nr:tetratricopeptide repeat protein [Thermoanaerobaculaceae bacterium]
MTDASLPDGREVFRVGDLVLDAGARLLTRGAEVVPLPPKTFELLLELARRAPGVVTRAELMDSVWPHEIVNDEALTQRVMLLRRALGDDPHQPRYVAAVPRWGYRLVAGVERQAWPADIRPVLAPAAAVQDQEQPSAGAPPPAAVAAPRPRHRALQLAVGLPALALLLGGLYLLGLRGPAAIGSVAILPFENVSGDAAAEPLCEGLAERLAERLATVPGLRVVRARAVPRGSSGSADPASMGRRLVVRSVLGGKVLSGGGQTVVTVTLTDTVSGAEIWRARVERAAEGDQTVEPELAALVAARLQPRAAAARRDRIARSDTTDQTAYHAYLKGRHCWNRRTPADFERAIGFFEEATRRDPAYARAWAGLADCWALLGADEYAAVPPRVANAAARKAVVRALELDDTLAEAHATMGLLLWSFDWDRARGERELQRALELDPTYATAHQWRAELLVAAGRTAEAHAAIEQARALDPLSLVIATEAGMVSYLSRDYRRAEEEFRAALELDPSFQQADLGLAITLAQLRRTDEALALLDRLEGETGPPPTLLARGFVLARAGRLSEGRACAETAEQSAVARHVPAFYVAALWSSLGEKDRAFAWLDRAVEQRSTLLVTLDVEPAFDPIRADPRFAAVRRTVGLMR